MRNQTSGILVLLLSQLVGCGEQMVGWPMPDELAPTVSATNPADLQSSVAVNTQVAATFSEGMDPLSITGDSFTLFDGASAVPGTVTYAGLIATFDPSGNLDPRTLYTATVLNTVTDAAGNPMVADYRWTFTSGQTPDATPPTVTFTVPVDNAIDVAINRSVTVTFSEMMDPTTLNSTTFVVKDGAVVTGSLAYSGVTLRFDPSIDFEVDTTYTVIVTSGATDLAGNPMTSDYTWTFDTGPALDVQPPSVTFTVPVDDANNVSFTGDIAATFDEPMDPATLTTANFTVHQLDTPIPGTVSYSNVTATFNPTNDLPANTTFSAMITTAAQDLAGNGLTQNYAWNFATGAIADTTRPIVTSTIPVDVAVDVLLDTNVSATFNEAMNPATISTATFLLEDGLIGIPGAVTQIGNTAQFNPTVNLNPSTEYTATVTSVAADLAGNTLATDYLWTFTTGAAVDASAPSVILVNPLDLSTNVPLNTAVTATFNEAMDPLSISTATFVVTGPLNTPVLGTMLYDTVSRMGTFTPGSDLQPSTTYNARVTTGAKDLAGNPLATDYLWTFSTGALPNGLLPVNLGSLTTFVAVAGAGLTNSNSSGITVLNGDVGLAPTGTCLGDGSPCTATNPVINGTLYANDPGGIAVQAKIDLTAAYVDAMSRPVGTTVNDISGMTLAPGVYTSGSTMSVAVGQTVTLDGQGDANAVWIFQVGSSLTVNNNAQVLLVNGAQAKNVFWGIFASSTLGSNVDFKGSVLAGASNSVGTDSVVTGRLLCTTGQITLLSNAITLP